MVNRAVRHQNFFYFTVQSRKRRDIRRKQHTKGLAVRSLLFPCRSLDGIDADGFDRKLHRAGLFPQLPPGGGQDVLPRPPERNPFPAGGLCFWPKRAGAEDL